MKKSILLALLVVITSSSFAQTKYQKLDSLLNYLYENDRFMGSVSIRENNKETFSKAYGYADFNKKVLADPQTKYKVGSITKTFTATIIFQLIEENKLALDTKLSKFYPQIKNADKITIGQMLGHRSGIFNFTSEKDFINTVTQSRTKEQMIQKIASFPSAFAPNSTAKYSNSNYLLLGYIIENITTKPYDENIKARITGKAGLSNTSYYNTVSTTDNEAFSYNSSDDKKLEKIDEWHHSQVGAAGALQSTSSDLNKFSEALFSGKLVSEASLEQMKMIKDGYGKGLFTAPFYDKIFFTHNGGIEGFTASFGYLPEEHLGFSILMNHDNFSMNELTIALLNTYYEKDVEFPKFESVDVKSEILSTYEGVYSSENFPLKITITNQQGKLSGQATGQSAFPLTAVSATEFRFDDAKIVIKFKENGFTFNQGGKPREFKRD